MTEPELTSHISAFPGVRVIRPEDENSPEIAWGDRFFLYDPEGKLEGAQQQPFATIVVKDYGDFDRVSNLDRPGVYRLNIGVGRETFKRLFGKYQLTAEELDAATTQFDFAVLDVLIPHPVYAPQGWVSILNPAKVTFEEAVKPLLAEAYHSAVRRYK